MPRIFVLAVQPLPDWHLWLQFNTGETRIFDCRPMLQLPQYECLADPTAFKQVGVADGTAAWLDGSLSIYPSFLYDNAKP